MKKIQAFPGGKLTVYTIIGLCILFITLCVYFPISTDSIYIFLASMMLLILATVYIKRGYISYILISETSVSCKHRSINWSDVYISLYISDPRVLYGKRVDVLYFSDHYLTKEEIATQRDLMFIAFTPLIPKRLDFILHNYNKKIKFIGEPDPKKHFVLLQHNKIH